MLLSTALAALISRVTTPECLNVKDCTDQGLYNLLVYAHWDHYLPHTARLVLPIERSPSYTIGHKKRGIDVDETGRVRNEANMVPPVIHQFGKGFAGKALRRNAAFAGLLKRLEGQSARAPRRRS